MGVWNKMRVSKWWQTFYICKSAVNIQASFQPNLGQKFILEYKSDIQQKREFFKSFIAPALFRYILK